MLIYRQAFPMSSMVVLYTRGLCESLKSICNKSGIQVHFKEGRTIKNLLVEPKERDSIIQKRGIIYRYECGR